MDTERKRIRCKPCNLVQYVNKTKTCVRCKQPFTPKPQQTTNDGAVLESRVPIETDASSGQSQDGLSAAPSPVQGQIKNIDYWLPLVFAILRTRRGYSERQLANHMRVQRTYISKLESGKAMPTPRNFVRFSYALGYEPAYVMRMTEFLVLGK